MYLQLYTTVCGQCVYPATGKQSGKSYWPVENKLFHIPRRRSASHAATNKKRKKCTLIHLPDILKLLKQNLNGLQRILRSSLTEKRPSRDRKSPKEHKHEINIHVGPLWSPRRISGHWSDSSMNSFLCFSMTIPCRLCSENCERASPPIWVYFEVKVRKTILWRQTSDGFSIFLMHLGFFNLIKHWKGLLRRKCT